MNRDEITAKLTGIFRDLFDDETIMLRSETTAADIADWDSVSHISLIVAIEIAFALKFKTAEIEGLKNVGDMVALIEGRLGVSAHAV